ncbi:peroxiredoxin family protein [Amycolatopsis sp. NPDC006131]|uniref:peroxiredoxin family protein n=1 Tax=Amycolatopsis sp. NPDC006131 TaxID=3156731 RepID=UPI0033A7BB67
MAKTRFKSAARPRTALPRSTGTRRWWIACAAIAVILVVLYLIYQNSQDQQNATAGGSGYRHVAGEPGAGATAPGFTLMSGTGQRISLADFRGRTVLLYFQEGLTCQPCWDQIKDLEQNQAAVTSAGVDAVVSITTDPAGLIGQKIADEKLSTPVLSDPDMRVSQAYTANQYGMMGDMRDGHSFILVGADGVIRWRADYGGAPDYSMYLPTQKMLADLATERQP